jgi:NADH-quinone oxidoreductase subunit C
VEPVQIAGRLKEKFGEDVLDVREFGGQVGVTIRREALVPACAFLRDDPDCRMDHLRDITAVDYRGKRDVRFEAVYHLYSILHKHEVRIKAPVPEEDCRIASLTPLWKTADWHERECFDLMGIIFTGHPNLKRILLPEDWSGHPLRKDYPLKGPAPEDDWPGYREVVETSKRLKEFEWNR